MNTRVLWQCEGNRQSAFRINEDASRLFPQPSVSADELLRRVQNSVLVPSPPRDDRIEIEAEFTVLIGENEHVGSKYYEQIAQLLAGLLEQILVAPKP
jgi:hypothetical protein